jgi:hypothetical protein
VLPALNRIALDVFTAGLAGPLGQGLRVPAVDGSTLRLPGSPESAKSD